MAIIPQAITQPTVAAIFDTYARDADTANRPHLGASLIGRECARELWFTFRWASRQNHSGRLLRLFERGQREEAVFVANLRSAGVTVHDVDPQTGEQFRFSDVGGHFGGSMDACALGILEAPKTWHVCEFKTHNAKSFAKLATDGLAKTKPEHAAQCQCYMHWTGMTRAFYLAVNKDTDELYSERLHADPTAAHALIEKARRIITAAEPPARLSDRPDWFACQWCTHKATCHEGRIPEVSCRTCAHATPELDGDGRWTCARFGCDLSLETQRQSATCTSHVFIPALLPWPAIDASEDQGWIEYDVGQGRTLRNGPRACGPESWCYTSAELATNAGLCVAGLDDPAFRAIRDGFGAEVVG